MRQPTAPTAGGERWQRSSERRFHRRASALLDALALREPDRVPVGLWGTIEGYQNLRRGIGMDYKADPKDYRTGSTTWTTDVSFELDLAAKLELDFVRISAGSPGGSPGFRPIKFEEVPFDMGIPPPDVEINVDEWGVIRKWTPHEQGGYYEMIGYPLFHATSAPLEEGLRELEAYPWPDPRDTSVFDDAPIPGMTLREYCKFVREETPFALMGQGGRGGLFEQAKYMVGYAKIFSDFIESPEFLDAMLHKLVDIEIEFAKAVIDECGEYFDWIRLSPEDLASEKTAFLSLPMYERQLLPHYKRCYTEIKKHYLTKNPDESSSSTPAARFPSPSCAGSSTAPSTATTACPRRSPGTRIRPRRSASSARRCSSSAASTCRRRSRGARSRTCRSEVRQRIWEVAHGGGYLCSSSHRLEHDVPHREHARDDRGVQGVRRLSAAGGPAVRRGHRRGLRALDRGPEEAAQAPPKPEAVDS